MNYGETKTQFRAQLNRRDCSDALADIFLQDAITRIQRVLRVPAMEKSVNVTLTAATYFTNGYLPIPTDYLKMKELTVNGQTVLTKRDLSFVLPTAACNVGCPEFYARQSAGFILAPTPLTQYTDNLGVVHSTVVRINYWAEFPTESAPTDDDILSDIANDLIRYGALSYGCDHFTDKRGDKFEARFVQILSDLQAMGDDDELAGGASIAPAYAWPEDTY
jgi:hypothetical protein